VEIALTKTLQPFRSSSAAAYTHHGPLPALFLVLALVSTVMLPPSAAADEHAAAEAEAVAATLASPRATLGTFLAAMNDIKRGHPDRLDDALATMDLSDISALVQQERGRDLAWTLLEIMDRTRVIDLEKVSARETGEAWLFKRYPKGDISIARVADGRWLFSKTSLAAAPAILDSLSNTARVKGSDKDDAWLPWNLRLRNQLSPGLKQRSFLLENWQWLGILLVVTLGILADKITSILLVGGVRRWRRHTKHDAFRQLPDNLLRPFGLMAMAVLWWAGLNLLGLAENALLILLVAVKTLAGISGVWGAYRLVDLAGAWLNHLAVKTESKLDDALVPLVTRTLKVFVSVIGIIFVADNLNLDVTSLLAGLGLGGLAFALAAKDVVQNLFGSITVLLDRAFNVGDWVIIGDIEGTVENIGFRSTRIRTFYNSLVNVPNSQLITASVDNMGQRKYRRLSCKIGVTYDTPPDRIEAFCEGIRELVRLHPYMRKDYFHVYFNEFGGASLNILIYVFWETPDWSTELRERHRFLLDILRLADRLSVEFAFPTQTVYWKQADGAPATSADIDTETGRAAARGIVENTTGLDVRPPPVSFDT